MFWKGSKTSEETASLVKTKGFLWRRKKNIWKKTWFVIKGEHLYYGSNKLMHLARIHLLLCKIQVSKETTKTENRDHCFELITPTAIFLLSADSEEEMNEWVTSLRIAGQLRTAISNSDDDSNHKS